MRFTKIICAAVAAAGALWGTSCAASVLDFTYTFGDGGVLSGVFDGYVTANGFTVTGLSSVTFDGHDAANDLTTPSADVGSVDFVTSQGQGLNGDGTPVIKTDGSYADLWLGFNLSGEYIFMAQGDVFAQNNSQFAFASGAYSDTDAPFDASGWSAQVMSSAPEPAAWALTLMGVSAAGAALRRRRGRAPVAA